MNKKVTPEELKQKKKSITRLSELCSTTKCLAEVIKINSELELAHLEN
jgi:hypothetical protein